MSLITARLTHRHRAGSVFVLLTTVVSLVFLAFPEQAKAQTAPVTPVCDRTPEVRDAIVEKVPDVDDCGDVTEAHLAEIDGFLDLGGPQETWGVSYGLPNPIPELKAGDFSGLSSLEGLWLQANNLTTLPPSLFHGLSSLKTLALNGNPLTALPFGIFSGLTALEKLRLSLHYNELTPPPGDLFSGLAVLTTLRLTLVGYDDPIALSGDLFSGLTALESLALYILNRSTPPEDLFSELPTLKSLSMWGNRLTTFPAGIFAGLSSLESLSLNFNPLDTLPPGIFSGLSSLKSPQPGRKSANRAAARELLRT